MLYRKLRRVWSYGEVNYIPNFKEVFPELKNLNNAELCNRFKSLDLEFFQEQQMPIPVAIRLTMPFAILVMLLMVVGIPVVFLITGNWHYPYRKNNIIINWFRALRLL